ncbi:MAG: copper amine oxidase N-terminal domain-containing protein, partial [Clostridia bacterium]|nr:copper amine oxidase N-terminal domain-containing protein [Clostridia bacterium]
WDEATQTATVKKQDDIISFSIDNASAEVNNELKTMEVPARLIDGKTMIPMRFLSEALGYTVEWDEATRTASVIEK